MALRLMNKSKDTIIKRMNNKISHRVCKMIYRIDKKNSKNQKINRILSKK
jgi:hypothetical protein